MGNSIKQLIEIYDKELENLLAKNVRNTEGSGISQIPIPKKGDTVQLSNKNFTIEGVGRFIDPISPGSMSELLNDEDRKIIQELEADPNGEDELDLGIEFSDDPYPHIDRDIESNWDIDDDDWIGIGEIDAKIIDEGQPIQWDEPGMDVRETTIAYYRAFHYAGPAFGIYYLRRGLMMKTRSIFRFCMQRGYRITIGQCYVIAKTITQFHEIYHHKIEAVASRIEVATRQPIYLSGFSVWYQKTRLQWMCFEETFANCYAYGKTIGSLSRFLPKVALRNIMIYWFNLQPTPYRNALKLIDGPYSRQQDAMNKFFENILKKFYLGDPRFGNQYSRVWSLFSHGTHPYINTSSNVYYIV